MIFNKNNKVLLDFSLRGGVFYMLTKFFVAHLAVNTKLAWIDCFIVGILRVFSCEEEKVNYVK